MDELQVESLVEMLRPFSWRTGGDRFVADSAWTFRVDSEEPRPIGYPTALVDALKDEEIPFQMKYEYCEEMKDFKIEGCSIGCILDLPMEPKRLLGS